MASLLTGGLAKVRTHGLKYSAVSVINVVVGQGLIFFFHTILDVDAQLANVLAVCISAGPAYYLSRAWVWGKRGKSHLTKEILPFWGFALAGLLLSTVAVGWASSLSDSPLVPNIANLAAFGVLWVVKFFVLDNVMFGKHHHHPDLEPGDPGPHHGHLHAPADPAPASDLTEGVRADEAPTA